MTPSEYKKFKSLKKENKEWEKSLYNKKLPYGIPEQEIKRKVKFSPTDLLKN
jgi:hypothetical protein